MPTPLPPPGALCQALAQAAQQWPGGAALTDGAGASITRAGLQQGALALAERLRAAGLQPDEPVHVAVANEPRDLVAIQGVWCAGGVAVPVHRSTPPEVAQAFQRRSAARWVVDGPAAGGAGALAPQALPGSPPPPPPRPLLAGAALVVFTSGSTGQPKGVVVSHDAFHGKIGQIDHLLRFGPADRTLGVLNITFSFGLWVSLLTLLRGGTLVLQAKFDAATFLPLLAGQRISRVGVVPTMMRALFAQPGVPDPLAALARQGDLRQVLIGGEPLGLSLAAELRQRFAPAELVDIYGLTETATCDFFAFPADAQACPGSIGRPAPQVQHRIVAAGGAAVGAGEVGELQIQSPYLMAGYLDEPALTAQAFDGGWFRTGDLARAREGGRVELMGRLKEVISRGGNKVTPVEIEQALCAHPDVAAAMATGVADALLGERIHVLLVPRAGATLSLAALRQHLAPRLERFKHPDAYHLADALPLGRTGKADRGRFKALVEDGTLQPTPTEPTGSPPHRR